MNDSSSAEGRRHSDPHLSIPSEVETVEESTRRAAENVRSLYPGARSTYNTFARVVDFFEDHLHLESSRVLLAQSICGDDSNSIEVPDRAHEMVGPFDLGGINGFPFVGIAGMESVARHSPLGGAVLVFYGPHLGISNDGSIGAVARSGRTFRSPCCSYMLDAMSRLVHEEASEGVDPSLDHQRHAIDRILSERRSDIVEHAIPYIAATDVLYEAIEARIDLLASRVEVFSPHLVLMGGVIINSDDAIGSFIDVRRFLHVETHTGTQKDWTTSFRTT